MEILVFVIWTYSVISPEEMADIVTVRCERAFTTNVNDIEHMESQSLPDLSIIKLYFHPKPRWKPPSRSSTPPPNRCSIQCPPA